MKRWRLCQRVTSYIQSTYMMTRRLLAELRNTNEMTEEEAGEIVDEDQVEEEEEEEEERNREEGREKKRGRKQLEGKRKKKKVRME